MERVDDAWLSISVTTRSPRSHEEDGVHYYFVSRERFEELIAAGGLLEWAQYSGNYYGTPRASIEEKIREGKQVILEIEYQGAMQVKERFPEAHLVFIKPPSMDELERRLKGRGTESAEAIQLRMQTAKVELAHEMEYDTSLVNDDIEDTTDELIAYINKFADAK